MKPLVRLHHTGGLLVAGIPFPQGLLTPEEGIHATGEIPIWWEIRSKWPDGSVKWGMLHTRTEQPGVLELFQGGVSVAGIDLTENEIVLHDNRVSFRNGLWCFDTPHAQWHLNDDITDILNLQPSGQWNIRLLEGSPISPLILLSKPGDIKVEWLLRLNPSGGNLYTSRRVSVCREGVYSLVSSRVSLTISSPSTIVSDPLADIAGMRSGFGPVDVVAEGLCDLMVEQNGVGVCLPEAGARYPSRITAAGNEFDIHLWPEEACEWPLLGGISFRHEICFFTSRYLPLSRVSFDPGYLAATQTLSTVYVAGSDPDRLLFPGFESGYRRLLDTGRIENLRNDSANFGLFHYGDWPLHPGQYGANGRCYADNEYDTAFTYYQGFAAFGEPEYMDIARRCAIHMADVDCNCLTGDMLYHGYSGEAEDHSLHRPAKGDMGHWWSDGLWLAWFLHGDPWCRDAALGLTEYACSLLSGDDDVLRRTWAICERNLGWPLIVATAACEAENHPEAFHLANRICSYIACFTRNPDEEYEKDFTDRPIVWWRTAMKDGCKPFMLGVILEGLERFYQFNGNNDAAEAITALSRYLTEVAWKPWRMDFTYEINSFGRGHRDINAQSLTPLFLRGLGCAYEISGEKRLQEIAMQAFHACLWTLHEKRTNGKDVALIGRSLGAFAAMATRWAEEDGKADDASVPCSGGRSFQWEGNGRRIDKTQLPAVFTDEGHILLTASFAPGSTDYLNQRALLHMDSGPGGCAISIVTFYDNFCVRIFDASGQLIETLDSKVSVCMTGGWQEGKEHTVEIRWRAPGEAGFYVDEVCIDRRTLRRPLSGSFSRLFIGSKPGGWTVKGSVQLKILSLGPGTSD